MHGKPLLLSLLALAATASGQERSSPPDSPALFMQHCASCHGETGDGKGWTELDRPARSFKDGGFSYGNTPGAITRTLTTGIPGTPMPSFDGSLTADERRALAEYVITLGPPVTRVERSDTLLEVGSRPRVVRGMLPPIAAGAGAHTRGLLLGTSSGMTFEYRTDDVRLLGLRQGDFCERTDWVGRGGTELKPLGKVVYLMDGGDPRPSFWHEDTALRAKMRGSWVQSFDDGSYMAGLRYGLRDGSSDGLPADEGGAVAHVEEACDALAGTLASGFRRSLFIEFERESELRIRVRHPGEENKLIGMLPMGQIEWIVLRRKDGFFECRGFTAGHREGASLDKIELILFEGEGDTKEIELLTLVAPEWSQAIRQELLEVSQ